MLARTEQNAQSPDNRSAPESESTQPLVLNGSCAVQTASFRAAIEGGVWERESRDVGNRRPPKKRAREGCFWGSDGFVWSPQGRGSTNVATIARLRSERIRGGDRGRFQTNYFVLGGEERTRNAGVSNRDRPQGVATRINE